MEDVILRCYIFVNLTSVHCIFVDWKMVQHAGRQEVSRCHPKMNHRNLLCPGDKVYKQGDPPWVWNQGQTSLEVQSRGISHPTKGLMSSKQLKRCRSTTFFKTSFCIHDRGMFPFHMHLFPDIDISYLKVRIQVSNDQDVSSIYTLWEGTMWMFFGI